MSRACANDDGCPLFVVGHQSDCRVRKMYLPGPACECVFPCVCVFTTKMYICIYITKHEYFYDVEVDGCRSRVRELPRVCNDREVCGELVSK